MQRRVTRLLPDLLGRHGACGVISDTQQQLRILVPSLPETGACSALGLQQRDLQQGPDAGLVMGQAGKTPDGEGRLPRPRRAWANLTQATSTAMHGYYMAHQRTPCTLGAGTCSFATVSSETAADSDTRARSKSKSKQAPATAVAKDQDMPTLTADMRFRPSRFHRLQNEVLHREMQLKLGDVHHWNATPRVHAVELTIMAAGDTRLPSEDVDRSDLLFYRLALEHMAGGERAIYVPAKTRRTPLTASGVRVRLKGKAALDFLEKLIYVVLPNQISFEGIGHAERVLPLGIKRRLHWNPQNQPPEDLYSLKLKVDNLLLYPDFTYNFELFEPLRSMRVNILISDAQSEAMARLYVSGFGLPLMKEAVVEE